MTLYTEQRAAFLAQNPRFIELLPGEPPAGASLPGMSPATLRAHIRPAADTNAALIIIVGWGDGAVLRALAEDPFCRQKEIHQLILAGEQDAFAASLLLPLVEKLTGMRLKLACIESHADIERYCVEVFAQHHVIPQLAGVDLIETHPLHPAGARFRDEHLAVLHKALCDRPTSYGNDVMDSFSGLVQATQNARILLNAPSIGQLRGWFGTTPVISIAAGPSLKDRLEHIRRLKDRCILVACDAVLSGLLDAGIDPHFVCPLERVEVSRRMMVRAKESRAFYAGLPVVMPDIVETFAGRAVGVFCGDRLYDWLCPDPGPRVNSGMSTGVLSVTVGATLTNGPVYLVGHDLARSANGSHWDGAAYAKESWGKVKATVDEELSAMSGYETRWIPGNDGSLVESITWWDRFREEIAHEAFSLAQDGRQMINPNAHDRIFARIDHTIAAPLPDPDSLPLLGEITLPAGDPERHRSWQARARHLPADCAAFAKHLAKLRDDLALVRKEPPSAWDVEGFAQRLAFEEAGISAGNRMGFAYFLRSALHNTNAAMHLQRRTTSPALSRWRMLDAIDQASQAMANATDKLKSEMEELVRAHC